jgi:hypothetical protein
MIDHQIGSIVRKPRDHFGVPFGIVRDRRPNHRGTGRGWHEFEYLVDRSSERLTMEGWHDGNQIEPATFKDVITYYDERQRELHERIKKLRDMVGTKVPKYNPEKVLGADTEGYLSDAYRHEDGSITYVFAEKHPEADSPRSYDGNVATLIQRNTRCLDIDGDQADLSEAYERFTHALMRRYVAMFRPDILHYEEHWSAGDSYGWGYVTKEAWERAMGKYYDGDVTPEQAFDQEVKIYGQWANNEIYGSAHVAKRGAEPDFVYGHLGYDDHRQIAAYHTDSPILEVLA